MPYNGRRLGPGSLARAAGGAAPWQPYHLSGCVLGLQGNKITTALGSGVNPWVDQVGLGNAVQATGTKQGIFAEVGGELAIQMAANDDQYAIADRDSLDFGVNDFTVGVRWYSDGTIAAYCNLFNKFNADADGKRGYVLRYNSGGTRLVATVDSGPATLVSSSDQYSAGWRTALLHRSGATVTLYVNGVSDGSAGSQGSKSATSDSSLLLCAEGSTWYGGDIAFAGLWAWNRALTAAEIAAVTAWRSR